ncbi:hypothetical protein GOV06_03355 [Candidatus Woesearchaeota archaeon]|nr:hypothetical protein [Candidatus Woesearchaeota archaeon]
MSEEIRNKVKELNNAELNAFLYELSCESRDVEDKETIEIMKDLGRIARDIMISKGLVNHLSNETMQHASTDRTVPSYLGMEDWDELKILYKIIDDPYSPSE